MSGSNRRPPACKAGALPAELIPLINLIHLTILRALYIASQVYNNQVVQGGGLRRIH